MPSEPLILAFDTSAAHCAAALLRGADIVAQQQESLKTGQAERLMPMLEEILAGGGAKWRDLTAIGVGTGPGNFTGIRISVSAARGLALGLGCPAVGVDGFDARALLAPSGHIAAIPAPRDQVYLRTSGAIRQLPRAEAAIEGPLFDACAPADLACAIARITSDRHAATMTPPAPLYARPADAAPASDPPPVILD